MKFIDNFLNRITMYRIVVYGLGLLSIAGIALAFIGRLSFRPTHMLLSLAILLGVSFLTDYLFAKLWHAPANSESWLITGLIMFLILQPADSLWSGMALFLAAFIASVSKFLIAWHGKHLFNPAALAAAFLSLTAIWPATWWVGSKAMWPLTVIVGLAVVRKLRRFPMVAMFVVISLVLQVLLSLAGHKPVAASFDNAVIASPLIFLSTFMLTEPATMPPRRREQIVFAGIIGLLYATAWNIGKIYIYPEVAIVLGNLYAFVVSPKFRVRLQLMEIQKISDRVYNYIFQPEQQFAFLPGQYMEWTLAEVPYDNRGNRRTFTIASSPTEQNIQLGLKYYEPASTYKAKFYSLQPGEYVYASQLAGNFTLTDQIDNKLAFIAGGIGITPFRSMIKYLIDMEKQVDIVLLYIVSDPNEFVYKKDLIEAAAHGIKTIPIVTREGFSAPGMVSGKLSKNLITQLIPDYQERLFYISGPNTMVDSTKKYLGQLGIAKRNIKTDHFSGY